MVLTSVSRNPIRLPQATIEAVMDRTVPGSPTYHTGRRTTLGVKKACLIVDLRERHSPPLPPR